MQQLFNPNKDHGCPVWDNNEVIEVSRGEDRCTNRWNYERYVRPNTPILTNKKKLEMRHFLGQTGEVSPMIFTCPCMPGTNVALPTQGGYTETVGFAYWKLEAELEACEIEEFVDLTYVAEQTSIPYEDQPFSVKWAGHQQKYIQAMNDSALNRYEVMASSLRYHGAYVIKRAKADDTFLDFGKSPCTTIVNKRNYGADGTWPDADIQAFKMHFAHQNGGLMPTEGVVGIDALTELKNHHLYRKIGLNCECSEPGNEFLMATESNCGISFAGTWDGIPLWLDMRTTINPITGRSEYMFPQDAVLLSNESDGGQRIRMAHTTNYIVPEFPVGDFFFDNGIQQEKNNYSWWATLEGTILMAPGNVDRPLMIRNIGRSLTPGPDCPMCNDILLDTEGAIASPQVRGCDPSSEEIEGADSENFEVCAVLVNRTGDKYHCSEPDGICTPGDWHQISPWDTGCPGDDKRVVSATFLEEQGFGPDCIEDLIRFGGLRPTDRTPEEGGVATPQAKLGQAKADAKTAKALDEKAKAQDAKATKS